MGCIILVFSLLVARIDAFYGGSLSTSRFRVQGEVNRAIDDEDMEGFETDAVAVPFKPNFKRAVIQGALGLLGGVALTDGLISNPFGASASADGYPIMASDGLMAQKAHGTTEAAVQSKLRWNCDVKLADRICSFNRRWAEQAGYWQSTSFLSEADRTQPITFYDSVTGKPLFVAPQGRSFKEFEDESLIHGWPSFRDQEVVWENVRCLPGGESISVDGTHLGMLFFGDIPLV
jgi:hypothetical protein